MPAQSKHCRKRPAANNGAQPVPKRVLPHRVDWKNGLEHAPPQPDWEGELVRLFAEELSQIKASLGEEETTVNAWSDCGGMVTEMFSLRRMASKVRELTGLKFKAKLLCMRTEAGASELHCHQPRAQAHGQGHAGQRLAK